MLCERNLSAGAMSDGQVVLGIDPGSRKTGYGLVRMQGSEVSYVASGCIKLGESELYKRLQTIFSAVSTIIGQYSPDVMAIEETFLSKNVQSTVKLSEARAAAMVAGTNAGLEIFEYAPRKIKQAVVGYGAAQKEQVQFMVKNILRLSGAIQADSADALACAICHAYTAKMAGAVRGVELSSSVRGRYRTR